MSNFIKDFEAQQKIEKRRWRMTERRDRPYIYVRDTLNPNKRISLKPLRKDNYVDCKKVWENIQLTDEGIWTAIEIQDTRTNAWIKDSDAIIDFLNKKNKASTNKNYFSLFRQLRSKKIPQTYRGISKWMLEKEYGTKPFQIRLELIRQLQDFYRLKKGSYPSWFTAEQYHAQRSMHNDRRRQINKNHRQQDLRATRGIVSKEEAEEYLDTYIDEFPWQCWAIAMMMCYGLRNHEIWYIKKLENLFIEVPGRLTKSQEDRIVWPAFAEWDKRYGLFKNFNKYQKFLRTKRKPEIKSLKDTNKRYSIEDEMIYFDGIGNNNHDLGNYITRNTFGVSYNRKEKGLRILPELLVKSPIKNSRQKISVEPYDLRHTWAVFMHTDPRFKAMKSIEECAEAMGHGVDIHKRQYLLWLNKVDLNKTLIKSHKHPYPG